MSAPPGLDWENKLWASGYLVAGIDEAGRGALAGPVVACALILPPGIKAAWLEHVRDSKELNPNKRENLFHILKNEAAAIGIGVIAPEIIDAKNILRATMLAMQAAVNQLSLPASYLLIDGNRAPRLLSEYRNIIRGDKICLSIACASIVAKVTRDRIMTELHQTHPGYCLDRHKGYGTKKHLDCLDKLGPSPIHRFSFAPVRNRPKEGKLI